MRDSQAQDEVEVFSAFAAVAAPTIDLATVQTRLPPEPDILCVDSVTGPRAFELVELIDNDYARRFGLLLGTKSALHAYVEGLPPDTKATFESKFRNALLYFRYTDRSTLNQRRRSFPHVFERLVKLPDDFAGDALEDDPEFSGILKGVSISRGRFSGPILDPESAGWVGDPTVPNIASKFAKQYRSTPPIELVAYIAGNLMFPDEVWMGNLAGYLEEVSKPLPFVRVWVFDLRDRTVKVVYDAAGRPLILVRRLEGTSRG